MSKSKAYIKSTGAYLPERVLSNADLEKMVDTSDEWIFSRTGMRERRIAREDEFTSDMGVKAAEVALERAGVTAQELDLIIVATLSPDYPFPSTACLIQDRLKATRAGAFDIQAACTGFIYALSVAKAFVEAGIHKKILVIASEKVSSVIDYQDRSTCVLFGDGSAACLVTADKGPLCIGDISLGSDGAESHLLIMPGGGCRQPTTAETIQKRMHYLQMADGKEVYRHAVRRMLESIHALNETAIDYFIPHQANLRIIESIAKRCNIPDERVVKTIRDTGNTSAASVAITLDYFLSQGVMKNNDNLLLVAFGAGLTWGSMVLTCIK